MHAQLGKILDKRYEEKKKTTFFFTFCHKGGVIRISEVIDIFPGNLDSSPAFLMMYSA